MMPRVSIVTPSFNQAAFLERTIDSVLSQGYPNLEYVVMDGGSTDGSPDIIRKYARHLHHWASQPDRGPGSAINAGFARCSGEILAYLNSDDVYEPDAIATTVARFAATPAAGLVYGDVRFVDAEDRPTTFPGKRVNTYLAAPLIPGALYHGAMFVPQQSAFWRRSVAERLGPMNEENWTCWDHEFFVCAALAGFQFARVARVQAAFRIHSTSISSTNRWEDRRIKDHAGIDSAITASGYRLSPVKNWGYRQLIRALRTLRHAAPGL